MVKKAKEHVYVEIRSTYTEKPVSIRLTSLMYHKALRPEGSSSRSSICIRYREAAGIECWVDWHRLTVLEVRQGSIKPVSKTVPSASITEQDEDEESLRFELMTLFDSTQAEKKPRVVEIVCECVPFPAPNKGG
ncbi:MAG: hypothetical protein WCK87_03180 [Candidatus Saccharibacteria bacterium]